MSAGTGIGALLDGLASGLAILGVVCLVAVPLALWKLCELGYWLYTHIHIAWE